MKNNERPILLAGVTALALGACAEKKPVVSTHIGPDTYDCLARAERVVYGDRDSGGVYFFPCTDSFPAALGLFKQKHPELVVTAMTGIGTGVVMYEGGRDIGFVVSTEKKAVQ